VSSTGQAIAAYIIVGNAYMRSLRGISGALHLGIFEQPAKSDFFSKLLGIEQPDEDIEKWKKN
jgi:hypothetical protein